MPDMPAVLHLTASERALFEKLPASLREGWRMQEEILGAYESPEELRTRLDMFRFRDPRFQDALRAIQTCAEAKDGQAALRAIGPLPRPVLLNLLFTVGAVTLRELIVSSLPHVQSDDDLRGLSELTDIRHALLESNAEEPA